MIHRLMHLNIAMDLEPTPEHLDSDGRTKSILAATSGSVTCGKTQQRDEGIPPGRRAPPRDRFIENTFPAH